MAEFRWPYRDLALLQPHCPGCGGYPSAELVDAAIPPLYFCARERCPVFGWDPSKPSPPKGGQAD